MEANKKSRRNVQQHFVTAAYLAGFTPDDLVAEFVDLLARPAHDVRMVRAARDLLAAPMSRSTFGCSKHCGEDVTVSSDGVQVPLVTPPAKAFAMMECGRTVSRT
jgi:hypothetical protein